MRRQLALGVVLAAVGMTSVPRAAAQERAIATTDSARGAPRTGVLARIVSLRLVEVPIEQALREVAQQGAARLAYSLDILPADARVTLVRDRITLGDAFDHVLRQTDLDVVVSPSGYVIVVRSPWPRTLQAYPVTGGSAEPAVIPPALRTTTRPQVMDRVLVMGTPATGAPERSLASAVSVRTGSQLTALGLTTMGQVFRTGIPGIVAWDLGIAGPFAQIGSVRGSSSFSSNYLKTYVDGVELASPYLLFAIDPFSIDRVEVIRGPQGSALYGSDAISGVVQVVTRKGSPSADWRPQMDAALSLGRQESQFASGASATQRHSAFGSTGGGTTSFGLGGTFEDIGGIVDGGSSGVHGAFGGARTLLGPVRVDATLRYADIRFTAPSNPLLSNVDPGQVAAVRPLLESQRIENETYGMTFDFQPNEQWRQTLVVGLDRHAGSIPPQREPATVADALLGATQERASKASLRYSMALRTGLGDGGNAITTTVGAERSQLSRERLGFRSNVVGSGDGLAALYTDQVGNAGLFGQVKLEVANALFVTAGLRGERNSNFGEHVRTAYAPMVGAAYTRDVGAATMKVRAAWGKGIRPPQPSMRRSIQTVGFRQLPNPNLEPEVQSGSEAGVELYLGDRLNFSLTSYNQNADGLIQQVVANPAEQARTIQYQNVGRIHNTGLEFEGSGRAGFVRADIVYSLTNSRVRALSSTYTGDLSVGDRVPEVPTASGMGSLTFERARLRATVGASYIGPWTGYNWVEYYEGESSLDSRRPLLRSYWTQYPSLTKPFAGLAWSMARTAEWYLRVDNLSNVQRNERDNLQITAGRTATLGFRFVH
jgi:outer membrane receptor protein involved in Fe transport